jgi:hypothetical protein
MRATRCFALVHRAILLGGVCGALAVPSLALTPVPTPTPTRTPVPAPAVISLHVRNLSSLDGAGLTENQVEAILSSAREILEDDDDIGAGDVACPVVFQLSLLDTFPAPDESGPPGGDFTPWASVSGPTAVAEIQRLRGNVKIVETITACPTIEIGIIGCAQCPAGDEDCDSIIVATWALTGSASAMERAVKNAANIWLHEIGHVRSLEHRSEGTPTPVNGCQVGTTILAKECGFDERPLMCPALGNNFRVCPEECARLRSP